MGRRKREGTFSSSKKPKQSIARILIVDSEGERQITRGDREIG